MSRGLRRIMSLVLVCSIYLVSTTEARVLRRGMRGVDVLELQTTLVKSGYDLAVDGVFGQRTEVLVQEIQRGAGLTPDGVVGQRTQAVLERLGNTVIRHSVQRGENLTLLAKRYGTTVRQIMECNNLSNPDRLAVGQVLQIPANNLVSQSVSGGKEALQWPVKGRISSGYGYRIHPILKTRHFHGGIDIAAPEGTPVKAAASGKVIQAGPLGNFGLCVVLDHGGSLTTWYGHNSKLLVRAGELVSQGQTIALVGHTGQATGPHLDFRIKKGEQTISPLELLPKLF